MTVRAELVRVARDPGPPYWLELRVPADYTFAAGQYLTVHHPSGTDIPLSIASPPAQLPALMLRFQPTPGDPASDALVALLSEPVLSISAAQGAVCNFPRETPMLILAGGSGVAQAFSLAGDRGAGAPTTVLWCVDEAEQAGDVGELETLPATRVILKVDPRRNEENTGSQWLAANAQHFGDAQLVLAGSPPFVHAMTDLLLDQGLEEGRLASDVYAYAPRPPTA